MSANRVTALAVVLLGLASMIGVSCNWIGPERFSDYIGPSSIDKGVNPATSPAQQGGPFETTSMPAGIEPSTAAAGETSMPSAREASAAASRPAPSGEVLRISIGSAILMSLSNNKSLVVDKFNPPITRTFEQDAAAIFDPLVSGQVSDGKNRLPTTSIPTAPVGSTNLFGTLESTLGQLSVSDFLPSGTTVSLAYNTALFDPANATSQINNVEFNLTQSLLRGAGCDVNLASLRQARLDTISSQYELRGFAQSVVAQVEEAYWDYSLAQQQILIFQQSLDLAQANLDNTDKKIDAGVLGATNRAAAQAELALSEQDLINAQSNMEIARLALLRLLSPGGSNMWHRPVVLEDAPVAPDIFMQNVEQYLKVAERLRPDLNQARLQVQRGDLQIVKTRNGLLPRLDVFINLGATGYADSFRDSIRAIDDTGYGITAGVSGDWSPLNRAPIADDTRAHASREQAAASVGNLAELVQLDVRTAYENVIRFRKQIDVTAAAIKYQEINVLNENERFKAGNSTSFQVAQAQRDLVSSQVNHVSATVSYLKSLVELYRLDGSLLMRRGIAAPGGKPAAATAWR